MVKMVSKRGFGANIAASLKRIGVIGFALVFGAAVAMPAHAASASKGKKVALLLTIMTTPYVAALAKAFQARAHHYGMDVTLFAAQYDAALQAQQIDNAIARKFDVLVLMSAGESAVVPPLIRAKAAGIPVIMTNNVPKAGTEDLYVTFVGQDQYRLGQVAAKAVSNGLKASGRKVGKVAAITGFLSSGAAIRRTAGFKEAVKKYSNIDLVAVEDGRWDTATSERIAGELYARFASKGGLDAVYGMADNQAVAAIHAAEAAGIKVGYASPKELVVVGGNCLKEGIDSIKAGKMYATFSQIPTDLGVKTADTVNAYFSGKKLPKKILLPVELIDKGNVAQWARKCTY